MADDETVRDPRQPVAVDRKLRIKGRRWVSRGGDKLEHALNTWEIEVAGRVVLDAGSSTGGFTDCLLSHGAASVYAVDVGTNQLDYRLRTDRRVRVMEKTNIMAVKNLDPQPEIAVADLSFRSIIGAAAHILELTTGNLLIALVKPQFEIKAAEDFDGIVRDSGQLAAAVKETAAGLAHENVELCAVTESPIRGTKGNREFLFRLMLRKGAAASANTHTAAAYLSEIGLL